MQSKSINIGDNCHVDIWLTASNTKGRDLTAIISPVNLCSGNIIITWSQPPQRPPLNPPSPTSLRVVRELFAELASYRCG